MPISLFDTILMQNILMGGLLQAAAGSGAAQQPGGAIPNIVFIVLLVLVFWLFMFRPQRKRQKQMQEFRNSLKKGDKVVTVGGIYGEVAEVSDTTVLLRVDGEVKLRVDKQGLVRDHSGIGGGNNA